MGDESVLATDAHQRLGKELLKQGRRFFARQQLEEAATMWFAGITIDPGDAEILNGLTQLEQAANAYVGDDASCSQLGLALKITQNDSKNHKQAMGLFKDHQCKP